MKALSIRNVMLLFMVAAGLGEWYLAYDMYYGFEPFPEEEFYFKMVDNFLRDVVLISLGGLLYFRKKRIPDRIKRYFPVVVTGLVYLGAAVFMVNQLSLDKGVLTTLSVLAGLNNNILLLLVTAMCYHKWLGWKWKTFYFFMYLFTNLTIIADVCYFWQTSMHVESVLFQNLNYYAVKGVLASLSPAMLGSMVASLVVLVLLFRVNEPTRHKPNFAWSLLCVAMVTISLNLVDRIVGSLGMYGVENLIGVYVEIENEKSRQLYRQLLAVPMNINFVSKAMFDTDKMAGAKHVEQRVLTEEDKKTLKELGIAIPKSKVEPRAVAAYDKVVLLILESVHRDYISCYNKNIPEGTTPFINELVFKYPHLNRYYSSAIPTTQGLNATFRSHLIMDKDVPGRVNPSIYTTVQKAGFRGIFLNASSQYYANELREYPDQFGMSEYYAKEYLDKQGYTGASGWGYHNDEMYKATLDMLEKGRKDKIFMVCKTLDMHQPYPYTGIAWENTPDPLVRDNPNFTVRGMYWVDRTLKYFFEEAEKRGLMDDRTLFIITADHNPHSGGEYTKIVTKENDKLSIAPLPLIFIGKNLTTLKELRTEEYASQIDLAPTLLHLLGLEVPEKFMGRNLLQPTRKPYALGYFGGKAFYWADDRHFVDQMDKPVPDSKYEDALSNYIIHMYGVWHEQ